MVYFLLRSKPITYIVFFLFLILIVNVTTFAFPSELFLNTGVDRSFKELGFWITTITVITVDPIIETYLFQVLTLILVRKIIKRPRYNLMPYILLSSIVFGIAHDSSVLYMAYATISGGILSVATYFAYYKKYKFFLVVCIHGVYNLIALIL